MSSNRFGRRRPTVALVVVAVALAGALSACSSDAPKTTDAPTDVTTEAPATEAAVSEAPAATDAAATEPAAADTTAAAAASATPAADSPTKIVSLSPSATETLFAIGAGAQVIAVDEYSNFPAEAKALPHDLSGFQPNVEAIAALKPDLVIHDGTTKLHDQLTALSIADLAAAAPADLSGVYAQIEQLGAATGHISEAAELVSKMTTEIDAVVKAAPATAKGRTYFHELDNTLYSVTSKSFIGGLYSMFGLTNIADALSADNPYPQLSAEKVIQANPQLIFLADSSLGESAATIAKRPGWDAIDAVKSGSIVDLPDDISSRWGPRVVDMVKAIAASLDKVPAPA